MINENIKVSVIVAAYNIENYIHRCLKSLIEQTLKNSEIIVINDGSSDNTLNVIKDYQLIDERIKIVDKENQGIIEARKSGLKLAQGEYIIFIDGDDWLEIEALDKLYTKAKVSNADIICYNAFTSYDNNKKEKKSMFNINKIDKDNPLKSLFLDDIKVNIWAKFIKLNYIFQKNIEFPENISYAEDLATVSSLFMYNPKVQYLEDNLYNYYQRQGSITNTVNSKILEINKAICFVENQLKKNNLYEKYKQEFEQMIYNHLLFFNFMTIKNRSKYHKEIYKQYIEKNIFIKNNKYISTLINMYPISERIRIKSYAKSYYLGVTYDLLRNLTIGLKEKVVKP